MVSACGAGLRKRRSTAWTVEAELAGVPGVEPADLQLDDDDADRGAVLQEDQVRGELVISDA